eukprot:4734998-Alexandrium_andersonii.AAC.1
MLGFVPNSPSGEPCERAETIRKSIHEQAGHPGGAGTHTPPIKCWDGPRGRAWHAHIGPSEVQPGLFGSRSPAMDVLANDCGVCCMWCSH